MVTKALEIKRGNNILHSRNGHQPSRRTGRLGQSGYQSYVDSLVKNILTILTSI